MDIQHSVLVARDKIHPNPWNPNKMSDRQQEAVAESLQEYGQILPLLVRPHPNIPDEFQIIDGEHRFNAGDIAGEIYCNVVDADDVQAKKLTIVMNETRGSADKIELATLLAELSQETEDLLKALPYSQDELDELIKLAEVDWDQFSEDFENGDGNGGTEGEPGFTHLTISVPNEAMDIINQCKDLIEQQRGQLNPDKAIAWGQVLESLSADYLATPQK